ncbi:MAG: helix-turn-helix transcriptional regulator [Coprococcus sp.]
MNQLKQIRLENKWTQQYVADKIGITKSAYSNIENQNRSPSLKVAIQLQNLFGLPIEKLLENKNSNPTPTKVYKLPF